MNKKVLTLCAGFLLAGSLTAVAQYSPAQSDFYRSRLVKAATLDAKLQDVTKINQEYYYQLAVDPDCLPEGAEGTHVLTVERDYSTGKLYLTAQKITDATLTHSLWQIKTIDRSSNGRVFSYVNKETGFELTFDHTNAIQRNENGQYVIPTSATASNYKGNEANLGWDYENDGLLDGCNSNWSWYTTDDNGAVVFDYKPLYSYFHNGTDSVMALKLVDKDNTGFPTVVNEVYKKIDDTATTLFTDRLKEGGLDGSTATNGYAIVAVKDSKSNGQDFWNNDSSISDLGEYVLRIKPVVAGAKVLNAAEINTMIDADGSLLTFKNHIRTYGDGGWNDAENGADRLGKSTKFTVYQAGKKTELNIADGANPFAGEFTAVESGYENLKRIYWGGTVGVTGMSTEENPYAGYNVLFESTTPATAEGTEDKVYNYLYVHEHNHENTPNGAYNGLQVVTQPYAYIKAVDEQGNSLKTNWGTEKAKRVYEKRYVADDHTTVPDPLEARYLWKVTYYATNDSLVLEPLNASRMDGTEMAAKLPFEQTHLAKSSVLATDFMNTVNAAKAYDTSYSSSNSDDYNSMYNKAAGVPVALMTVNDASDGDYANLLTVGSGHKESADAFAAKWAAACKSETSATPDDNNPAYVTNGGADGTEAYQAAMGLRLEFDNKYTALQRATMAHGLYFMNLVNPGAATAQTEHRVDGAYIVEDMKGHVVYDVREEGQQDFTHMPATQWVVEQQPCLEGDDINTNDNPVVKIWNREFNGLAAVNAKPVFEGQLYTTGDGKMYTIDYRHYAFPQMWSQESVNNHGRLFYNAADTVKFNAVNPQTTLGYFNATEDELRNNVFMFQHMYDMSAAKFLTVGEDNQLKLGDEGSAFELFRSEGWVPVPDSANVWNETTAAWDYLPIGTYSFKYVEEQAYGYASEQANVQRLDRTFYKIKVKDANNIDNDHKFVAIDNQHKYVIATEEEINDADNHLTFAIVTLKENNCLNGTHGYAIVNSPAYVDVTAASKDELKGLTLGWEQDEFGNSYQIYYKDNDKDGKYNANNDGKDVIMVKRTLSIKQADGKLAVEAISLDTKIADLCETTTDAFALVPAENRLYRDLNEAYAGLVNNDKKVINIMGIDEQSNEFLFEDIKNGMNYLGIENKSDLTTDEGFYVDKVAKSSKVMPQYLFAVAADSVPAYTYCNKDGHGSHGINPTCDHAVAYPGYVEGRFLINFNDSIYDAMINKLNNADKYKSNGYTRLGFVEAVHRGDSLYVLTNGRTLESLKMEAEDGSGMYICPDSLAKDQEGKIYTIVALDGKHNNAAFSLRNVGDDENSFMIESNDAPAGVDGYSQVGSFAGAWVKIENGVPVLAKYKNANGNHNTGDSTDAWFNAGDYTDAEQVTGEFINQGARFTFEVLEKDASATANEEITADATVSVVATDGAVIVKGAEGKNVIVSTILGKVVANEVINSDNETIAAPAGIVVVSVDGESFKVAVK